MSSGSESAEVLFFAEGGEFRKLMMFCQKTRHPSDVTQFCQ